MELQTLNPNDIDLGVADRVVDGLRGRLIGLTADTKPGYEQVKAAIAEVREIRTGVEKARKALKKSSLEYGRKVDKEAKRVTALLKEIEDPLKLEKQKVDDAIEQERLAKEREALAKHQAEEAARQAAKEEAERQEREALEAERKRLEEEREAERLVIEEEREAMRAEREAMEAERRAIEADKEAERQRIAAEKEAERQKVAAELRKKQAAAELKERERVAKQRRPDAEKIAELCVSLVESAESVSLTTEWGKQTVADLIALIKRGRWAA